MPAGESWRLFFALEFPADIRQRAFDLGRQISRVLPQVIKWVELENLHITLKFLGEVSAERVGEVTQVGRKVAEVGKPAELVLRGAGAFPSLRNPRVLWVGVSGDVDVLGQVADGLEELSAQAGLAAPEGRPFKPHLTIGRVRRGARIPDLSRTFAELAEAEVGRVTVEEFVLMRSHLSRHGPTYEVVERFVLGGGG
ncbi:MAG: RNA 2',3'-cyclic phosphodiesterase [Armatimonadetes bacterium]|nr:RNA 2',3'-cyclic phosphodiesterase [Armatimonadota bacterium]